MPNASPKGFGPRPEKLSLPGDVAPDCAPDWLMTDAGHPPLAEVHATVLPDPATAPAPNARGDRPFVVAAHETVAVQPTPARS